MFRPGTLSEAEWKEFASPVGQYDKAIGYVAIDHATAYEPAFALFADDPRALAILEDYPDIASGYAPVDFARQEPSTRSKKPPALRS